MKRSNYDAQLRELTEVLYKQPQQSIKQFTFAIFICQSLVMVLPFRLLSVSDSGLVLALVCVLVNKPVFDYLANLLLSVADAVKVMPTHLPMLGFIPTYIAFFLQILEEISENKRIPLISFLVDVSPFLTVWVGAMLFVLVSACDKFPLQPREAELAPPEEPSDDPPDNDSDQKSQ